MTGLRFFADHCVPTSIIHFLREQGHEVFHYGIIFLLIPLMNMSLQRLKNLKPSFCL